MDGIVCGWLVFDWKVLSSTLGSSPSYVYYESSVFETRVVGTDGQIQTSRKELIKSNIPELVRQKQQDTIQVSQSQLIIQPN